MYSETLDLHTSVCVVSSERSSIVGFAVDIHFPQLLLDEGAIMYRETLATLQLNSCNLSLLCDSYRYIFVCTYVLKFSVYQLLSLCLHFVLQWCSVELMEHTSHSSSECADHWCAATLLTAHPTLSSFFAVLWQLWQ